LSDIASIVLSGILPAKPYALEYARERLTLDHFPLLPKPQISVDRTIYQIIDAYAERYGEIVRAEVFEDMLSRSGLDPSRILLLRETFNQYCETDVTDSEFRYAVDSLIDTYVTHQTGEAFAVGFDILEKGAVVDGTTLQGHEAARQYFNRRATEIEENVNVDEAPEGDIREDPNEFLRQYAERKNLSTSGVFTGIQGLDQATGGLQNGELCLLAAYTNQGKTQFVTQWAWHAAIMQGKNVFFGTTETVRDQVWRRLVARHSRQPQFGLPSGLNVSRIKDGTLSHDELQVLGDVLTDLRDGDYGKLFISQMPSRATLSFLEQRMQRQQKNWNIDLVVFDYLALLTAEVKRGNEREEFNDIFRGIKKMITAFNNGKGVPFVSPWQMSRAAYQDALKTQGYTIGALSDTSESEKTADLVVSLLRDPPTANEAAIQILKARDSATMQPVTVQLDYSNSYLGDSSAVTASDFTFGYGDF
jgi:replicative DNA helicase